MKAIPLLALLLYLLLSCASKQKQFQDFDPLKKALANNNVVAYVSYAMHKGKLLKGDTVVVDSRGNEILRDGFEIMAPTVTKKFDSLDRIVSEFTKHDISWFVKFEYESPSQYVLIRNEFVGGYPTDTCRLLSRTITEYDPETGLPIRQEQIRKLDGTNTEKFEFDYVDGRIVKERMLNEDTWFTEYQYSSGNLSCRSEVRGQSTTTDYFSLRTGLRDSTVMTDTNYSLRLYYKYYYKK